MTDRSTEHSSFVIERTIAVPPARAFQAFADPEAKAGWFLPPVEWAKSDHAIDFRIGGTEQLSVKSPDGVVHRFDARYNDIVADKRIIYTYDMYLDERRLSVSVATIEFVPAGTGVLVRFTEQVVFLDGGDTPISRETGSIGLLDNLEKALFERRIDQLIRLPHTLHCGGALTVCFEGGCASCNV